MEHMLHEPAFWVGVAFFIFVGLAWKPISSFAAKALDARAEKIAEELREAVSLREEAQALLAEYQKKQRDNMEEAKRIVEQTKIDAQAMATKAEQELRDTLEKRKAMAIEKIAQAEIAAVRLVKQNVADIAVAATRSMIEEKAKGSDLIDAALDDINQKLH